jgi:hypothetical protein
MKLWKYFGVITLAGVLAVSCKSPVYVQKDETVNLRDYHTYMWVDTKTNDHDNSPRATAFADQNVHNAVNAELAKQGWREVSSNPDVLLSYDILVERSTEQQSNPVYSQPFTRMYYNPYRRGWGTIYYPSQFIGYQNYEVPVKEGTITITMTDARTDKVAWQAWTTEKLNYARLTPDEINKSVRNIFNKFDMVMR